MVKATSQTVAISPYQLIAKINLRMQRQSKKGMESEKTFTIGELNPLTKPCPPTKCRSEKWSGLRYVPASKAAVFSNLFCTKQFVVRDGSNGPDTATKCWMCLGIWSALLETENRHLALLTHSPYGMVLPNWPAQAEATAVDNQPRIIPWG